MIAYNRVQIQIPNLDLGQHKSLLIPIKVVWIINPSLKKDSISDSDLYLALINRSSLVMHVF